MRVNLTTGTASMAGVIDVLVGFENATGGAGADSLTGDGVANELLGGNGEDVLVGLGGDDTLRGGNGRDRLVGLLGNDTIIGDAGIDTVDYSDVVPLNERVGVIVDLAGKRATGDGADLVVEIENVLGSNFDDRMSGGNGANVLRGFAGNDIVSGRRGVDTSRAALATMS